MKRKNNRKLNRSLATIKKAIPSVAKRKSKSFWPSLFVKLFDMNNMLPQDWHDCNPERPAVVIGLKWTF